jgi:hypothetical protein
MPTMKPSSRDTTLPPNGKQFTLPMLPRDSKAWSLDTIGLLPTRMPLNHYAHTKLSHLDILHSARYSLQKNGWDSNIPLTSALQERMVILKPTKVNLAL